MGLILKEFGDFCVEVRRESFYVHHETAEIFEDCSPEYYLKEIDDLINALLCAKEYLENKNAIPKPNKESEVK